MAADRNYRYRYYAQTPDESRIARDLTDDGMIQMEGSDRDTREAVQFIKKSYQEKKEEAEPGKKMSFMKLLLFWDTGMVCIVGIVILERRKMRGKEKS